MDWMFSMTKRGWFSQSGYSLIEVLVASAIFIAVVAGVFAVTTGGSDLNRKEMLRKRAYQVLERVLEKPEYTGGSDYYLDLPSSASVTTITLPQDTLDNKSSPPLISSQLQVKVKAENISFNGLDVPVKKITARIEYADKGVTCAESLQTIVTLSGGK